MTFSELEVKFKKVLNPSRFRFVVIIYSSEEIREKIKKTISESYPKSLINNIELKNSDYQRLAPELYKNDEGFVYIDNFIDILENPELYNGFNQRRDKIAKKNFNLICFVSSVDKDYLLKKAPTVIPDLWDFRNTIFEI